MKPLCLLVDDSLLPATQTELNTICQLHTAEAMTSAQASAVKIAVTTAQSGFPDAWFDVYPALELIAVFGVGTDKIDLDKAAKRNIRITTTKNILTQDVALMAIALLLAATRDIVSNDNVVRAGQWKNNPDIPLSTSIVGKKMGIVGLGAIGHDIGLKAQSLGMEIAYYNRKPKDVDWAYFDDVEELAANSDVLVAAISATPNTQNIIDANVLKALGENGWLINIARGQIVDENALIDALTNRRIAGAGLDVFVNEPDIDPRWFDLDNVVLAPHRASATNETRQKMGQNLVANVKAYIEERPLLTQI